ncbi:bidirectional sugar transporter N3-like [Bidens hawaiensis]|uniref:bidirectional sugar transporter N3-like n=1 Tax=Bidens hawaiensis TaxID=980011 RepID=UPI00404A4B41
MSIFSNIQHPLTFTFGILGNIISLMVYLAPAPTFYRIIMKKSTEGFHSIPYVVALFSSMIWVYYSTLKTDATLLITINAFGCIIETLYITIYIAYAPKKLKVNHISLMLISFVKVKYSTYILLQIQTTKLVVSLNFVGFWVIALSTHYLAEGPTRVTILGWICLVISVSVFVAPLSVMKMVIRTKSVEFMPFGLSFFLSLSAVMWFFYGLFQKDIYVALPNIIGFVLGVTQMGLYFFYKNYTKKNIDLEQKLPASIATMETYPVCDTPKHDAQKDTDTSEQIITLKSTREENIEAGEPPMVSTTQPINDLIKDVLMKEDTVMKASMGCTSTALDGIADHDQKKTMEGANQVYLVESAA